MSQDDRHGSQTQQQGIPLKWCRTKLKLIQLWN